MRLVVMIHLLLSSIKKSSFLYFPNFKILNLNFIFLKLLLFKINQGKKIYRLYIKLLY